MNEIICQQGDNPTVIISDVGIPGPQGPAGPTGPTGPAGADGTDGKTILNGTGAPDNTLGVDGDFYIDTSADFIYGPKVSGAWGSGTSIVGPAGPPGTGTIWGQITGTLSNQTDLQSDLNLKANTADLGPLATEFPTGTPSSTTFLRGDGQWAAPPGGGGAVWGNITGTLSNQTDLQTALNAKQATGNYVTALTGDVAASGPGSAAATLATVNANVGSFGSASNVMTQTVNAKGLTTAAANVAIQIAESQVTGLVSDLAGKQATGNYITALSGDGTASGPGSAAMTLATVNSNVGSFGSASSVATQTVNAKGLTTAAASVSIQIAESQVTGLVSDLANKLTAVSVASANGFAGTSSGGATPALTLSTSTSGLLTGSAGALVAATSADLPTITLTGPVTGAASGGTVATTLAANSVTNTQIANATINLVTKVTGVLAIAHGGTANGSLPVTAGGVLYTDGTVVQNVGAGTSGNFLQSNGAAAPTWVPGGGGTGTVTSVGLALPASVFSVSGSPVTGSGTLTGALISQTANTVLAAPNGSAGTPTFRALTLPDLPTGAKPAGASTNIQYNNSGSFGGASNAIVDTNGYMNTSSLAYNAAYPTSPAAGVSLLAKDIGGVSWPVSADRFGNNIPLGASQFGCRNWYILPQTGAAAITAFGSFPTPTVQGTNVLHLNAPGALFTAITRVGLASTAAANAQCGIHPPVSVNAETFVQTLGLRYLAVAGNQIIASTSNWFVGVWGSVTVPGTTAEPSSLLNICAMGADSTDTNVQIYFNDGSGTATKINLGANFPAKVSATDVYAFYLTIPTGAASYNWQVVRLNTGDVASGTQTTDLPGTVTPLQHYQMANTMTGTSAIETTIFRVYAETPY